MHCIGFGDVEHVDRTTALFVQRFKCGGIHVGCYDARALRHKCQGRGATNALPCGGDECSFSS